MKYRGVWYHNGILSNLFNIFYTFNFFLFYLTVYNHLSKNSFFLLLFFKFNLSLIRHFFKKMKLYNPICMKNCKTQIN